MTHEGTVWVVPGDEYACARLGLPAQLATLPEWAVMLYQRADGQMGVRLASAAVRRSIAAMICPAVALPSDGTRPLALRCLGDVEVWRTFGDFTWFNVMSDADVSDVISHWERNEAREKARATYARYGRLTKAAEESVVRRFFESSPGLLWPVWYSVSTDSNVRRVMCSHMWIGMRSDRGDYGVVVGKTHRWICDSIDADTGADSVRVEVAVHADGLPTW